MWIPKDESLSYERWRFITQVRPVLWSLTAPVLVFTVIFGTVFISGVRPDLANVNVKDLLISGVFFCIFTFAVAMLTYWDSQSSAHQKYSHSTTDELVSAAFKLVKLARRNFEGTSYEEECVKLRDEVFVVTVSRETDFANVLSVLSALGPQVLAADDTRALDEGSRRDWENARAALNNASVRYAEVREKIENLAQQGQTLTKPA